MCVCFCGNIVPVEGRCIEYLFSIHEIMNPIL